MKTDFEKLFVNSNKKKTTGVVFYKGPSMIDGRPIVAIATNLVTKSNNIKTGDMINTYILRADISPLLAKEKNYDFSICGDCVHREFNSCYVNVGQGVTSVYNAYINDSYTKLNADNITLFANKNVRIGSYGDPSAVPYDAWSLILEHSKGWTGYTHQWKNCDHRFMNIIMASVDTEDEYKKAQKMGWRTFRTKLDKNELMDNEISCPASIEFGQKTNCNRCKLCRGNNVKAKSIAINVHGCDFKVVNYTKGIKKKINKKQFKVTNQYVRKIKTVNLFGN